MTIRYFEETTAHRLQTLPLAVLKGFVLGIEAEYYLQRHLTLHKEALVPALGGAPFALRTHIEDELDKLAAEGATPLFVFSGMGIVNKNATDTALDESNQINARGWELYDRGEADNIVATFERSESIKPKHYYRLLQKLLFERKLEFMVAPYGAAAQLSYLYNNPKQFIDAIAGSSELFLYYVDKVITVLDFQSNEPQISWLSKPALLDEELRVPDAMFIDACVLSGTSYLTTFPPLAKSSPRGKSTSLQDAVGMISSVGRNVGALCSNYEDDPQVQRLNYLDLYRRGRLAIKHHVVLMDDGKVMPLDAAIAPSDVHEFIGQRLPDELYFYLSKGIIAPRVLEWLTSGEVRETIPLDSGESMEYRRLVHTQLAPFRREALALISQFLHRYYYSREKDVTLRLWFDKDLMTILNHKNLNPQPHTVISTWHVREKSWAQLANPIQAAPGSLTFSIKSLGDVDFASSTITKKNKHEPLSTKAEIQANTIWRFLHLRGYINDKHHLTLWGKAYSAAIAELDPKDQLEEVVFVAIELLRLGLLRGDSIGPQHSGAPQYGSEKDKTFCSILSRVACLAKLHHKPVGYNGPLDRHLLAFHSIINAVRSSLRDLVEVILTSLLLNGEADRDRSDWTSLSLELPFLETNSCGLGIAVKMYLDTLASDPNPTSPDAQNVVKDQVTRWVENSEDIRGDLDYAFRLWTAISAAIKTSGSELGGVEHFEGLDEWLQKRH